MFADAVSGSHQSVPAGAVAQPHAEHHERGDDKRSQFEPVLRRLDERDRPHPGERDIERDEHGDQGAAAPAGPSGDVVEHQARALELGDEVEPADAEHEH